MPYVYREVTRKYSFILFSAYIAFLVLGGAVGLYAAFYGREELRAYVRVLPTIRPSVFFLMLRAFIPLGITYLAVHLNCRVIIPVLSFVKTAVLTFACGSLLLAYPHAGWLIMSLIMASACMIVGIYHWLWLRCFAFSFYLNPLDICICAGGITFVLLIDLFLICPFTASLFTKM